MRLNWREVFLPSLGVITGGDSGMPRYDDTTGHQTSMTAGVVRAMELSTTTAAEQIERNVSAGSVVAWNCVWPPDAPLRIPLSRGMRI